MKKKALASLSTVLVCLTHVSILKESQRGEIRRKYLQM